MYKNHSMCVYQTILWYPYISTFGAFLIFELFLILVKIAYLNHYLMDISIIIIIFFN